MSIRSPECKLRHLLLRPNASSSIPTLPRLHILPSLPAGVGSLCQLNTRSTAFIPQPFHMVRVTRQVWRSDTGQCVYEEAAAEGAGAGGQMTLLQAAPGGGHVLMAATTDCRLRFYASQARMLACCSVFGRLPCWTLRCDRSSHGRCNPLHNSDALLCR